MRIVEKTSFFITIIPTTINEFHKLVFFKTD